MMDITEVSIIHHAGIVMLFLWLLAEFNLCHPLAYFLSLIYLYLVHERYIMRLRKKVQFEEKKQANQRRVLSDSETVRWLNHSVEKIWPICMEQISSQKILLPIIPWFLEKYKPWTAKKAVVQHLYLGRNPPIFTDMRVLRHCNDDDHLVLELGMNFLTADDFSAILAVKLRKRLGFGMWAKMHLTGMHVEGKILIGVKFLRDWPYLGRLRVCFVEPPYFQMTVKPIFTHGLDVTELPGIAGWLDKLLSIAFEQTLVEPNMLVVNVEKFASGSSEGWFSVDEREPVAYVKLEVIEASNMKPSDLNGLADPYVKGQIGAYRFRTKIHKKTLTPKWQEEFKIPIVTWESPNILALEVRDKDHFVDDILGDCSVNISDFRSGQRHDMWLPLQNITTGRLRLAVTVVEESDNAQVDGKLRDWESFNAEVKRDSFVSETTNKDSFSSVMSDKSPRVADNFEPINIEGQKETGIWVHHPGSEISQSWEPRKGNAKRTDTKVLRESKETMMSNSVPTSGSLNNNSSSTDENPDDNRRMNTVRRGLRKLGSVFHRSPKEGPPTPHFSEEIQTPHVNIKAVNMKEIGVKFVVDEDLAVPNLDKIPKEGDSSSGEDSSVGSPAKGNMKDKAKSFFKNAEKSARSLRNAISRKGSSSRRSAEFNVSKERELLENAKDYSSDDNEDSLLPPEKVETIPVSSDDVIIAGSDIKVPSSLDHVVVQSAEIEAPVVDVKSPTNKVSPRVGEVLNDKDDGFFGKSSVQSPSKTSLEEGKIISEEPN